MNGGSEAVIIIKYTLSFELFHSERKGLMAISLNEHIRGEVLKAIRL